MEEPDPDVAAEAERDALKDEIADYKRGYVSAYQHNKLAAELHALKDILAGMRHELKEIFNVTFAFTVDGQPHLLEGLPKTVCELADKALKSSDKIEL